MPAKTDHTWFTTVMDSGQDHNTAHSWVDGLANPQDIPCHGNSPPKLQSAVPLSCYPIF